jgi:hypothetical protein
MESPNTGTRSIGSVVANALEKQSKKKFYSVHGERALILRRGRAAMSLQQFARDTVLAHSRTRAAKWGATSTESRMLTWLNEEDMNVKKKETIYEKSLRHLPFFQQYSKEVAMKLISASSFRCYHDSDVIFWQGDPGNCAYVVCSGEINIYVGKPLKKVEAERKKSAMAASLSLLSPRERRGKADNTKLPTQATLKKLKGLLRKKSTEHDKNTKESREAMSLEAEKSKAARELGSSENEIADHRRKQSNIGFAGFKYQFNARMQAEMLDHQLWGGTTTPEQGEWLHVYLLI